MFLFLHIPHTGGRVLRQFLTSSNVEYKYVHNAQDIQKLGDICEKRYFILRPVVERIVAQCIHYSKNLKRIGIVNYMNMEKLPGYNPDNPYHFIELPENQNVYCKFLLNRTDFSQPITDDDFEQVKALFNEELLWDKYSYPLKLPNLEQLVGPINCSMFKQTADDEYQELMADKNFVNEIKKINYYDHELFSVLNNE